ncbi:ankyrin protein unc44 [Fusarium coicis]|nr:ankyrin protein unc44 [Fusarium coicis]
MVNSKDRHGQTPLSVAIDHGDTAAMELLLERGAQIDYNYKVIFKLAFEDDLFHKVTRVALLGLHYLDEEFRGPLSQLTRFSEAAFSGEYDIPNRIWIPASWRTPLSRAAELGDQKAVRLLLKYDARPEDKGKDGETPLSRAEKNDRKEVIQILRESMGQG